MQTLIQRMLGSFTLDRVTESTAQIDALLLAQLGLDAATARRVLSPGAPPPAMRYRHFTLPKRDGSPREVLEPGPQLKATQRRLLGLLCDEPHPAALGFRRGHSIADHAWAHAGAALIVTADIQDFFPSTAQGRVAAWWQQQGYGEIEVRLLTRLTTYQGALPQGAPSSPPLSNLVNRELDAALERYVKASGGSYTRYVDDLALSWPAGCRLPAGLEAGVRKRLREVGYTLHPRKGWHVWHRHEQPELTGLVLRRNGGVELPESLKRIMRTLAQSQHPHDRARLAGYQGYEAMVRRPH